MSTTPENKNTCPCHNRTFPRPQALKVHLWWMNNPEKLQQISQPQNIGPANGQWKEKPGYTAIHEWVKRRLPKPELCQGCNVEPSRDLANISQEYKRDLSDWEWLCRRCHMTKDGRLVALVLGNKSKTIPHCDDCGRWLSNGGCTTCKKKIAA